MYRTNFARVAHTLCFIVVWYRWIYRYHSGLFHWYWGNHPIAPAPVKQSCRIWVIILQETAWNICQQNPQQICVHVLWVIVYIPFYFHRVDTPCPTKSTVIITWWMSFDLHTESGESDEARLLQGPSDINPCRSGYILGSWKYICWIHLSFLNTENAQAVEILPHGRQGTFCHTLPIPSIPLYMYILIIVMSW